MNNLNLKVTPILTLNTDNAVSTLIEIDGLKMLFDCGWDETFSNSIAQTIQDKINFKIDYIFLSCNSINHIGALPLLMKSPHCKETKIYATTPIAKLGLNILIDAFVSKMEQTDGFDLFSDLDMSSAFLSINEIKFKENIKFSKDEWEMEITPLPSGESLGSSLWKLQYKLKTIVYAPNFSIKSKFVCDAFHYESLKNVNLFITNSKMSTKIPLVQNVVENEFKKILLEDFDKGRNIFIPSDTANLSLEILIRLEKILEEFYMTRKSQSEKFNYRIVVCSYTSHEIVESIKSLIVFYGTAYSQQFSSYYESPLNLTHVKCIKDLKEYHDLIKNHNLILISSFESLDTGLSYKLLPEVISDSNFRIICTTKSHKTSFVRKILDKVKEGIKVFDYLEIKRIPIQSPAIEINNNQINTIDDKKEELNLNLGNHNLNMVHKPDLSFKKKLFAKGPFPMFAYHQKQKLNEYGIELSEKEIKLMKSVSEDQAEIFESSFKTFLYAHDQNPENLSNEIRLKVKRQDLFSKANYEKKKRTISIQAKFAYFDLFDSEGIDALTKENVLREINPKDFIIFIDDVHSENLDTMINKFQSKYNQKCKILRRGQTENLMTNDQLLKIKYDSCILNSLPSFMVKDYGFVYEIKNAFLKIKSRRGGAADISILTEEEEKIDRNKIMSLKSQLDSLENFYTTNDYKLINLKREISKLINEEIFICKSFITNSKGDFKLWIDKKELVLEGNLNATYLKLRKCIYKNLIRIDDL